MLNVLLIDANKKDLLDLAQKLRDCPIVCQVIGQAHDLPSAVHLIHQYKPQLVFIDTDMPHYSGFKLTDFFDEDTFKIILTTSQKGYALKAFKAAAIGYLLKPIVPVELYKAVQKAAHSIELNLHNKTELSLSSKIEFSNNNGSFYISLNEINFIESKGRVSDIHSTDHKVRTTTLGLKDCQELLEKTSVFRVHRSYMINLLHIKHYAKGKYFVLENDKQIDIGKNFKEDVNTVLSYFIK